MDYLEGGKTGDVHIDLSDIESSNDEKQLLKWASAVKDLFNGGTEFTFKPLFPSELQDKLVQSYESPSSTGFEKSKGLIKEGEGFAAFQNVITNWRKQLLGDGEAAHKLIVHTIDAIMFHLYKFSSINQETPDPGIEMDVDAWHKQYATLWIFTFFRHTREVEKERRIIRCQDPTYMKRTIPLVKWLIANWAPMFMEDLVKEFHTEVKERHTEEKPTKLQPEEGSAELPREKELTGLESKAKSVKSSHEKKLAKLQLAGGSTKSQSAKVPRRKRAKPQPEKRLKEKPDDKKREAIQPDDEAIQPDDKGKGPDE